MKKVNEFETNLKTQRSYSQRLLIIILRKHDNLLILLYVLINVPTRYDRSVLYLQSNEGTPTSSHILFATSTYL